MKAQSDTEYELHESKRNNMTPHQSSYTLNSETRRNSLPDMVSQGVNTKKSIANQIRGRRLKVNRPEEIPNEDVITVFISKSSLSENTSKSVPFSVDRDTESFHTTSPVLMPPHNEDCIDGVCIKFLLASHPASYARIAVIIFTSS